MGTPLRVLSEESYIQWIPAWQGLDDFQKYLRPCAYWMKVALASEGLKIH